MNAIIVFSCFADPFEPFEDDECDYYISVAPFEPFEFDDRCWERMSAFKLHSNHLSSTMDAIIIFQFGYYYFSSICFIPKQT